MVKNITLCSNIKPKISIIASAIRTELWLNLYNSLLSNETPFEIIFVGNKKPDFNLPANFKYIYSITKPSQCYEIGFREAIGDLINWSADDVIYSERALDIAYIFYHSYLNKEKLVVAFNCIENGSPTSQGHRIYDVLSPRMAPIGMMNRKQLLSLGGYDKRFICGQAENDLVMRNYQDGGWLEICEPAKVYIEHNKAHKGISKFRVEDGYNYHLEDRRILEDKWIRKIIHDFQPFENDKLLTITQGNKGEWV